MVTRRRFFLVLGVGALTPYSSLAQQQTKVWRVGFLSLDTSRSDAGQSALEQFPDALAKLGYREGRNLEIEWRWADGRAGDLRELAAGLVRARVDVIVARTNDPIQAAKDATRSIPIVMLNGSFPVETGLVESLARPGGNVTGTAYVSSQTIAKQMQLLKEIVPRARRIAILASSTSHYEQFVRTSLDRAAGSLGLRMQYFEIRRPEDIAATLEEITSSNVDALWYQGSSVLRTRNEQIIAALLKRKLPSIANIPLFAEQGGLVHYAPDVEEFFERTAGHVDRILKGAKPADLPVHQPTKYELVVNLKTARAIGIAIPPAVLTRADRVIG
jgi:putative tryptophan/tyrosine transport system substrate-binding protein